LVQQNREECRQEQERGDNDLKVKGPTKLKDNGTPMNNRIKKKIPGEGGENGK